MSKKFDSAVKIAKSIKGKFFEEVADEAKDGVVQQFLPYRMKRKYAWGLAGGAVALGTVPTTVSAYNNTKINEMGYGELSHMSGRMEKSELLNQADQGQYDLNNHDGHISTYGAEGNIVFALHNSR